jgi:TRAP-type C4-dicarboxylate transport system substrate-binding protein
MIDAINAMGATATPIPFSELYQSLRTGVVDGAENSATVFVSSKYDETGCNCFTFTEHFTNQHVLAANQAWLESLPQKYRRRIEQVARDIVPAFNQIWDDAEATAVSDMEAVNVRVNRIADKRPFFDRVEEIADEFFIAYPHVPRDLYDRTRAEGAAE